MKRHNIHRDECKNCSNERAIHIDGERKLDPRGGSSYSAEGGEETGAVSSLEPAETVPAKGSRWQPLEKTVTG